MQLTGFRSCCLRFAFYKLHISLHLCQHIAHSPSSWAVETFVTSSLAVCLLYFLISWATFTCWRNCSCQSPSGCTLRSCCSRYAYDRLLYHTERKLRRLLGGQAVITTDFPDQYLYECPGTFEYFGHFVPCASSVFPVQFLVLPPASCFISVRICCPCQSCLLNDS